MEWLNLHTSVLDSAEFVGADQVERGTWLCLQRYCVGQENGGVIEDCKKWKDRQWQQLVRVTLREVTREARLWEWDGDKLVVFFYPHDAEATVAVKREVARANGKLGGRPKKIPPKTGEKPTSVISEKAKGKEKEGNEKITPLPPEGGESEGTDLLAKIKSLRREWGAVAVLSAREARVFVRNRGMLGMFPEDAWGVIREFLAARLPEGAGNWQPVMLVKFLEDPGGVYGRAKAWKEKQRPGLVVVPKQADGPAATMEDFAEIFKKPEPRRVNS